MYIQEKFQNTPEKDLHQFFIAYKDPISYIKLKSILKYLYLNKYKRDVTFAFYNLINWGVIVQNSKGNYQLSEPFLIKGQKVGLGVNLIIHDQLLENVFPGIYMVNIHELGDINKGNFTIQKFDGLKVLKNFPKIDSLISTLCVDSAVITENDRIEEFNAQKKPWKDVKPENAIFSQLALFKRYKFNQYYFEYILKKGPELYKFNMSETEKVSLLKVYISINKFNQMPYTIENCKITIKSFFPGIIERILRVQHLLATGEFPTNRCYIINPEINRHLTRIFVNKINKDNELI